MKVKVKVNLLCSQQHLFNLNICMFIYINLIITLSRGSYRIGSLGGTPKKCVDVEGMHQHVSTRGAWGGGPPRKFLKNWWSEKILGWGDILSMC